MLNFDEKFPTILKCPKDPDATDYANYAETRKPVEKDLKFFYDTIPFSSKDVDEATLKAVVSKFKQKACKNERELQQHLDAYVREISQINSECAMQSQPPRLTNTSKKPDAVFYSLTICKPGAQNSTDE